MEIPRCDVATQLNGLHLPRTVDEWLSGTLVPPSVVQNLPGWLAGFTVSRFQFHCLAMAVFASLVAPFGGFFASGFKRAIGEKDFGSSIPGHGGWTDRMDCMIVMGVFSWLYLHYFLRDGPPLLGPEQLLDLVLKLDEEGKTRILRALQANMTMV